MPQSNHPTVSRRQFLAKVATAAGGVAAVPAISAMADTPDDNQPGGKPFRLWVMGCAHVGTDLRSGRRESLGEAIRQSENGGREGSPPFDWDIAVYLGDMSGTQQSGDDKEGREVVRQFGVARKHRREDFYCLAGNHDASQADEPQMAWFRKWVDPLGENTEFSGVDPAQRPYPVKGSWERYEFRVGNLLFFTHHHFDHNCDFPCFTLSRWDSACRGKPPLKVYGPPPPQTFVERLFGKEGAFIDDINSRIEHPVSQKIFTGRGGLLPRPAPLIETKDVGPGKIAESDYWRATAVRVHHVEPTLQSLAFRFDTEQGSIVFAADCGDCKSLRDLTQGADTLVIGCVYIGHSKAYDGIITGTGEAADIATACGVRRLVLSHAAPGLGTGERKKQAIADAARNFSGTVCFPDELTTVELTL